MVDFVDTKDIARRAKAIYAERLRATLERDHLNKFVAIEPDSGDYFVGSSLTEAIRAARRAHPTRVTHTLRIGHDVAVEIGWFP